MNENIQAVRQRTANWLAKQTWVQPALSPWFQSCWVLEMWTFVTKAIQKSVKAICSFADSFVLSHTHPLVSHTKQIYPFDCEGEVVPFDLRNIPKQLRGIGTSIAAAAMHCAAEHALLIVGEITTRG